MTNFTSWPGSPDDGDDEEEDSKHKDELLLGLLPLKVRFWLCHLSLNVGDILIQCWDLHVSLSIKLFLLLEHSFTFKLFICSNVSTLVWLSELAHQSLISSKWSLTFLLCNDSALSHDSLLIWYLLFQLGYMPLERCSFGFCKKLLIVSTFSLIISLGNFLQALLYLVWRFLALFIMGL